ncbi:pseudouridine synthase [Capsulimonas corticalis]|uniref:Pseudouridine synthase n=1 Tax=Capsulimonas corticalis TaxID=2219043 RepID=A0A402CPW7_9BACT|nr:RluA family pseudouridine synthase [Capsulimonas corticalis]BDI32862.1 pseudouridine synthase [Capsulimonas corticalis]
MESLLISPEESNVRLDVFLADRLPHFSRARIQKLIAMHSVQINGEPAKSNYRTRMGDEITIDVPAARPLENAEPENIPLDIVYEDDDLIVVNKQKGLVVHPAPGAETGTLVNALLAHCKDLSGIGGTQRPGIVHRLDKDTSGLLVVAKNDLAHESLSKQIQARTAVRKYNALLWGRLPFKHAVIDAPITRHPVDRKRMTVYEEGGMVGPASQTSLPKAVRQAVTEVRLLEHLVEFSWIEAILQTGRTHQIRVHSAFAGYPVVGDSTYGGLRKVSADLLRGAPLQTLNASLAGLHGQALHAHFLSFDHPRTKRRHQFHAPLPDEIAELLDLLRRLDEAFEF